MEVIDINNNNLVTKYNKILYYIEQLEDLFIDYVNMLIDNAKRDIKSFKKEALVGYILQTINNKYF